MRSAVGLIDVGTLGKIEVSGPDAAEFLERVYTGRFANLKVGMTRYAVMLDEAGVIIDDGVVARLSRAALLLHHHDHRLGHRLSGAAAAQRACGASSAASSI